VALYGGVLVDELYGSRKCNISIPANTLKKKKKNSRQTFPMLVRLETQLRIVTRVVMNILILFFRFRSIGFHNGIIPRHQ
jgi:hypothetical protein